MPDVPREGRRRKRTAQPLPREVQRLNLGPEIPPRTPAPPVRTGPPRKLTLAPPVRTPEFLPRTLVRPVRGVLPRILTLARPARGPEFLLHEGENGRLEVQRRPLRGAWVALEGVL